MLPVVFTGRVEWGGSLLIPQIIINGHVVEIQQVADDADMAKSTGVVERGAAMVISPIEIYLGVI